MVNKFFSKLKKYLKLYLMGLKYGIIESTTYRFSFVVELIVEFGYQIANVLTLEVIYQNLSNVAGWDRNAMFVLYGFSIIITQVYVGLFGVWNLWVLPNKVRSGEVDFALLKPINSQFSLSLGRPYFTSVITMLFGLGILVSGLISLNQPINFGNLIVALIMFVAGIVITYSILVIIASFSFIFPGAYSLPRIGGEIIFMKKYPRQVFQGFWKFLFYLIIPIIFLASVPAEFIIKGIDWRFAVYGIFIAVFLLFCSIKVWNRMIQHYSSASS